MDWERLTVPTTASPPLRVSERLSADGFRDELTADVVPAWRTVGPTPAVAVAWSAVTVGGKVTGSVWLPAPSTVPAGDG